MHLGLEQRHARLAARLGRVHRDVGVAQQVVGRVVLRSAGGDADAGAHVDFVAVDPERCAQRADDPLADGEGVFDLAALEQDGEFVAAQAGRQVGRAQAAAQPVGDRRQQGVAGGMAE